MDPAVLNRPHGLFAAKVPFIKTWIRKYPEPGHILSINTMLKVICHGCPFKKDCIKGNNCKTPFEDRNKTLSVSRKMEEKRAECHERITSEYGTQLRMNRSIQAEGSFANVKEDMNFRRYLYRGSENVLAQSTLLAMAFDISKIHHKIMSKRIGTHLFELKKVSLF